MDQDVLNQFRTRLLEKLGWKEDGADPKVQYNEENLILSPGFMEIEPLIFKIRGGPEGNTENIVVRIDTTILFAHREPCVVCSRLKSGQYSIIAAVRFVQSEYNAWVRNAMAVIEQETEAKDMATDMRKIQSIGEAADWKYSISYRGETLERDSTAISYSEHGSGTGRNRRYNIRFCADDLDSAALEAWVTALTRLERI